MEPGARQRATDSTAVSNLERLLGEVLAAGKEITANSAIAASMIAGELQNIFEISRTARRHARRKGILGGDS